MRSAQVRASAKPRTKKTKTAKTAAASHLRVVTANEGEAPEPIMLELPVDKVVVDRRRLLGLRMSEAASTVADKAKGEQALSAIRSRKGGADHVYRVNPYDLHFEEDHNPRDFSSELMRERVAYLAVSIATRGVRQPLDVYTKNGTMFVNGGETRWRATLHAINFLNVAVEGVPIILSSGENESERMINQWLGNDGSRFQHIEEAKLFRRYIDLGGDIKVFSQRIGRPAGYIMDRIKWLEMPGWLQKQVSKGVVVPSAAYDIWQQSGENDPQAREMLAGATQHAETEGVQKVRPRHVRAVETGESTKISRVRAENLAAIFNKHGRDQIVQWFGTDDAEVLFRAAKMGAEE